MSITQCDNHKAMWRFILSLLISKCELKYDKSRPLHPLIDVKTDWFIQDKISEQQTKEGNRETEIEKEGKRERQAGWWADIAACLYDLDPAVDREGR